MVYLYWIAALVIVGPLVIGLPFLSRNRVYRIATLFAGMNVGIVTLSFFITLLRWGPSPDYLDQFHTYFARSLPTLYIASLIIGSTIVSRHYLIASTRIGATFATLGCLFGLYSVSLFTAGFPEILSITTTEGFPSFDILSDMIDRFLVALLHPDPSALVLIFVSGFIALNGTAAAVRILDNSESEKDKATE